MLSRKWVSYLIFFFIYLRYMVKMKKIKYLTIGKIRSCAFIRILTVGFLLFLALIMSYWEIIVIAKIKFSSDVHGHHRELNFLYHVFIWILGMDSFKIFVIVLFLDSLKKFTQGTNFSNNHPSNFIMYRLCLKGVSLGKGINFWTCRV